jgi:hypothetical protein
VKGEMMEGVESSKGAAGGRSHGAGDRLVFA